VVTLLCWYVLTGQELTGRAHPELVRSADEFDPQGSLLAREIRELRVSNAVLAYVDDLVEASHGPADALQRVESGRLKRGQQLRELTDDAVKLLRCMLEAAAVYLEDDRVVLRAQGSPVALDVAEACELDVASIDRALRRRAVIRGIHVRETAVRKCVSVISLVGFDIADTFDCVDDAVLELPPGDVAMLIGSAAALSDEIAGQLQNRRAGALRVANLVAAMRLPRGLWREAHRQSLAVWVCVGGARAERPWVADLGAVEHIELTDVAAMSPARWRSPRTVPSATHGGPGCRACSPGRRWCPGESEQCGCAGRLEPTLAEAHEYEHQASRRVAAARGLTTALINGVAAGALTLDVEHSAPGTTRARQQEGRTRCCPGNAMSRKHRRP
jgi:hypothetical protein